MNNCVLIGMPGAGKTTKGRRIAAILNRRFIDTDDLISVRTGMTPGDIVASKGREAFLKIQDEAVAAMEAENAVIATGGGIIYSKKAMERLKTGGTVFFLNISADRVIERLAEGRKLSGREGVGITDLYEERQPLYRGFADHEIICDDKGMKEIVKEIIEEIRRREMK